MWWTGVQAHFEDSQFENVRQDGKRPLKWNAIPTLFNVPNKPQPVTVRRVNPLDRKRLAGTSATSVSESTDPLVKVPRIADHIYCKTASEKTQVHSTQSALRGTDHNYPMFRAPLVSTGMLLLYPLYTPSQLCCVSTHEASFANQLCDRSQ